MKFKMQSSVGFSGPERARPCGEGGRAQAWRGHGWSSVPRGASSSTSRAGQGVQGGASAEVSADKDVSCVCAAGMRAVSHVWPRSTWTGGHRSTE